MKKIHLLYNILLFLIFLFSIASVNAALTCVARQQAACNAGERAIFRMSDNTNAHAQVWNAESLFGIGERYDYVVCCSGITDLYNKCSGKFARVLNLSSQTNAHAESGSGTDYSYGICMSAKGQQISCGYATNPKPCSEVGIDDAVCVATLSSTTGLSYTNSHVADCVTDPYDTKICCGIGCRTLGQTCSGTVQAGTDNCCSEQGVYCSHGVDGTLVDGESRCCKTGEYWDPIQLRCRTTGTCNPDPCPYTISDILYWSTPECLVDAPLPYEQACCLTNIYGDNAYHYTNVVVR